MIETFLILNTTMILVNLTVLIIGANYIMREMKQHNVNHH